MSRSISRATSHGTLDRHSFGRSEPELRRAFGERLELEMLVLPSMYARI
jgi:hypothetical protein